MKSLYFGASLAPRMEQAASQIHDSRLLAFLSFFHVSPLDSKQGLASGSYYKLRVCIAQTAHGPGAPVTWGSRGLQGHSAVYEREVARDATLY